MALREQCIELREFSEVFENTGGNGLCRCDIALPYPGGIVAMNQHLGGRNPDGIKLNARFKMGFRASWIDPQTTDFIVQGNNECRGFDGEVHAFTLTKKTMLRQHPLREQAREIPCLPYSRYQARAQRFWQNLRPGEVDAIDIPSA